MMGHRAIPKILLALLPVFVQSPISCEVDLRHISLQKKDQAPFKNLSDAGQDFQGLVADREACEMRGATCCVC